MLRELNPLDENKCISGGNLGKNPNLLGNKYIGTELNEACNKPQKNLKQIKFFWVVLNHKSKFQRY